MVEGGLTTIAIPARSPVNAVTVALVMVVSVVVFAAQLGGFHVNVPNLKRVMASRMNAPTMSDRAASTSLGLATVQLTWTAP